MPREQLGEGTNKETAVLHVQSAEGMEQIQESSLESVVSAESFQENPGSAASLGQESSASHQESHEGIDYQESHEDQTEGEGHDEEVNESHEDLEGRHIEDHGENVESRDTIYEKTDERHKEDEEDGVDDEETEDLSEINLTSMHEYYANSDQLQEDEDQEVEDDVEDTEKHEKHQDSFEEENGDEEQTEETAAEGDQKEELENIEESEEFITHVDHMEDADDSHDKAEDEEEEAPEEGDDVQVPEQGYAATLGQQLHDEEAESSAKADILATDKSQELDIGRSPKPTEEAKVKQRQGSKDTKWASKTATSSQIKAAQDRKRTGGKAEDEDWAKVKAQASEPPIAGVSPEQYQDFAKELLDLIVDQKDSLHRIAPVPDVAPGFLRNVLPTDAPQDPEPFSDVLNDVQDLIMKGVVNNQSPFFHGNYPLSGSSASRLGSMLQDAFGHMASKWSLGPSVVELEAHVLDWLVKSMGLPEFFQHKGSGGRGGGIILNSTSESTLIAMCAARNKKIKEMMAADSSLTAHQIHAKLVAYTSKESHFCHEKMARYAAVQHHQIPVTKAEHMAMTGERLRQQIQEDIDKGLVPFFVCNTLGTTATCAFDRLVEIGPLCSEYGCWLHIDAAYAGSAFLCPEFRHHMLGADYAHSISINFYKWMLVGLNTCGFWVKDSSCITEEFGSNAYCLHDEKPQDMPNYVDWQLHTCRSSRSLQLWFVIRLYGIKGLQQHIRSHVAHAKLASKMLKDDDKFTIVHPQSMGIVCFKLKDQPDSVNKRFLEMIQKDRRLFLMGSTDCDGFFLRLCMNGANMCKENLELTMGILDELGDKCLQSLGAGTSSQHVVV